MDTEQLKMVIDLIRGISGDAQSAFIWYLVITVIPAMVTKIFIHATWAIGIFLMLRTVIGGIRDKLNRASS